MTPKEYEEGIEILDKAQDLANKMGEAIFAECGESPAVAVTCAAIILSRFFAASQKDMFESIEFFMMIHRQTEAMVKELDNEAN